MSNNDDSGDGEEDIDFEKIHDPNVVLSEFDIKPQDHLKKKNILRKGKWTVSITSYY